MSTKQRQQLELTTQELRAKINQLEVALANEDDEVTCYVQPGPRPKRPLSFCCEGHERREMG